MTEILPNRLSEDEECAIDALAGHLLDGTLALVLGAGISAGIGLPTWWELVSKMVEGTNVGNTTTITPATSNEDLRLSIDDVINELGEDEYRNKLRRLLYVNITNDVNLISHTLLISIGAMIMNSRRGSVREILTFNFDNVLERYLELHGFIAQSVVNLPCLRREADVTIYHPHGYLPNIPDDEIERRLPIFSQHSYDEHMNGKDMWMDQTKELMLRKVVLCIGMSRHDPTLGMLLRSLKDSIGDSRSTGYWLLGPGDDDRSDTYLRERNIVPIRCDDYTEYPQLILKICQTAAAEV